MRVAVIAAFGLLGAMAAPAWGEEVADWIDPSGVVSISFVAQGWAVTPSESNPDRIYPPLPLLTITPGGRTHDPAACALDRFPEPYPQHRISQRMANQRFAATAQSMPLPPEGRRFFERDGVAVNVLDFAQGDQQSLVVAFMVAVPDGPVLHVLSCLAPAEDQAAVAQMRAIGESLQFNLPRPSGPGLGKG